MPRGGVALFKRKSCLMQIDPIFTDFKDCIIVSFKNCNVVLAAIYIPPSNSTILMNFTYIRLLFSRFHKSRLIVVGDLNCRYGDIHYKDTQISYQRNPDSTINENGRMLRKLIEENEGIIILSGLIFNGHIFRTGSTFFRGESKSQDDIILVNDIRLINAFDIMKKLTISDHCPLQFSYFLEKKPAFELINNCTKGIFRYDHYDINTRVRRPIDFSNIDVVKVVSELEIKAEDILIKLNDNTVSEIESVNKVSYELAEAVYDACKNNYKNDDLNITRHPEDHILTSHHYKAIAEANLWTYHHYNNSCMPNDSYILYLENWAKFDKLAKKAEDNELNIPQNKAWKDVRKDGKKMWDKIDWSGKAEVERKKDLQDYQIYQYFTNIFQSHKMKNLPTIANILGDLEDYQIYIPILDDLPDMDELNRAMKKIHQGVSLDGIPPEVIKIMPLKMKECLLLLIQNKFTSFYPFDWNKQILHAVAKPGHSYTNPDLRGIAIAQMFCRIFDNIIECRLASWYTPNKEQGGFRKGQGCLLQLFMLIALIAYAKSNNKNLFVAFIDYEKAFDYTNRMQLIRDLMNKGCGSQLTRVIAKMYSTTEYMPKLSGSKVGDCIKSDYGVTQGRASSVTLYSLYVSDMPDVLRDVDTTDFMDQYNLAQIADDTMIVAEFSDSLRKKLEAIFGYSERKFQIINTKKTKYCNFSASPESSPICLKWCNHTKCRC